MPKSFHRNAFLWLVVLLTGLAALTANSCQGRRGAEAGPNATNTGNILEATQFSGTLMGVQYESWFTPHNLGSYENAEAIPILGKYSSYDVNVIRKHEEWFENLGVDWLLLDWSNMLWIKPAWEEHRDATHELEETTDLLFKTYAQMEKEGKHPPKLVIMVGLQNGPPVPHAQERLNGIIAWTKENFLDKPEYKNQWLYYHGKPLLVILNNVGLSCDAIAQQTAGVVAPDWTVRYMGSQLQDTHVEKCGFWSWIDAPIRQVLTSRDGMPEEVVVTPSSYPISGSECNAGCNTMLGHHWLDPRAVGRDHGAPYLESWKVAFENRPKFIQIHQWNEYAEQYNLEFSDDLEPTQMDACGARVCGGWGYYFVNMTKALISLYRNQTPDITVLALSCSVRAGMRQGEALAAELERVGQGSEQLHSATRWEDGSGEHPWREVRPGSIAHEAGQASGDADRQWRAHILRSGAGEAGREISHGAAGNFHHRVQRGVHLHAGIGRNGSELRIAGQDKGIQGWY